MTFTGDYGEYFGPQIDVDCINYLQIANDMVRCAALLRLICCSFIAHLLLFHDLLTPFDR